MLLWAFLPLDYEDTLQMYIIPQFDYQLKSVKKVRESRH